MPKFTRGHMSELSRLKQRIETIRLTGNPVPGILSARVVDLLAPRKKARRKMKAIKKKAKGKTKRGGKRRFYKTREWREFRYQILTQLGAKCMCCGVTPAEGAVMNVDHIIPISKAWDRRLDPTNMQVLCARCNEGKGGHDQTDWRPTG